MIDRMKDLVIENGILQHQSNDWEAKYKHLLYEELPKLTAENESLILAIKKLIEERDTAMSQRHIRYIGRHWYGITYHDPTKIPKSDKTLWSTQKSILIGYIRQLQEKIDSIVRCKDCKYFKFGNGCFLQSIDYDWEEQMYADDFCSRGERRDE